MTAGTLPRSRARVDPRIQLRRDAVEADRSRRRRRRVGAFVVVTLLAVAGVGVTSSPVLDVDHVRTVGAASTGPDAVLAAARIERGTPMVSVDLGGAEARIERLPWVADASVTRDWPGTVRIAVIERVAVATTNGPQPLLVDLDGRLLGSAAGRDGLAAVGAAPVGAEPGDVLPAEARARVRVVAALPSTIAGRVTSVTSGDDGIALVLDDGLVVVVGDATQLRSKFDVVVTRLAQADRDTIATLNVSVPDRAALTRKPSGGP